MVLPSTDQAEDLCYRLLRLPYEPSALTGNLPHQEAAYWTARRLILLPARCLWNTEFNVVLHEIGHAMDHLALRSGQLLSSLPQVARCLRKVPPLDPHCARLDSIVHRNLEQFATSFEAFFNERKVRPSRYYHSIHDLDQSFINLMQRYLVRPFRTPSSRHEQDHSRKKARRGQAQAEATRAVVDL